MTTRDLDAALASFFEREATADGAATILEAALEQTSRRRPRPAWVTAVRGVTVGSTLALDPRTRSRIGYALVLAALLAAIVVGALFLAGTRPPRLSESLAVRRRARHALRSHGRGMDERHVRARVDADLPGRSLVHPGATREARVEGVCR